jgi:predicted phage terminase large subunit-like protein
MQDKIDNDAILYSLFRKDLVSFVMGAFCIVSPNDKYVHSWYIELICEYLLNCKDRKTTRLIINIPPRHMKSLIVNVIYPAWLLGHNPAESILTATYSRKLFEKHSMSFLRLVHSSWYKKIFPNVIIDREALEFITTTAGGYRFSTTVAGQLTGTGGNYIIIDDPLNAILYDSQLAREKVIEWYSFSLSTRQNQKDTVMVLIAQRLHEEDLPGYLMQQGNWEVLKLPAIAEEDETFTINGKTFGRRKNDVLAPERFGIEFYEAQRKELKSEYAFAGQYQQRPAPVGGGELKIDLLQYYDGIPNYKEFTRIICVDPANEKKKTNDYTVFTVWGLGADQNLYLLDMTRDRLNPFEREEELFFLHNKYKVSFPVLYEKYGKDADINYLMRAMNNRNYRFPIKPVGGQLEKNDRIRRLSHPLNERKIWIPRQLIKFTTDGTQIDLIKALREEMVMFPNARHDDILDCMSRIFDGFPNQNLIFPNTNVIDFSGLNKIVI